MPEPKRSEMGFRPDPRPRKRDKGPDVWGALERRIYREGDDPPYRFVGARTGIYDPEAKLPGQAIGMAFNADDDADKATPEARMAAQEGMTVVPVPPVEHLPD